MKVISSRKPTWTARTTMLDSGLKAAVTTWKVENATATANTAGVKWKVPCCRSASASETGWVIASLAKKMAQPELCHLRSELPGCGLL